MEVLLKRTLRIALLSSLACATLIFCTNAAQAQRVDIGFGVSTTTAPGATTSGGYPIPSLTGGAYPGFSFDVLPFHNMGIGADIFWKASQADYAGQGFNFRPVLWNINYVYSPKLASHAYLELDGGIGALSTRYYTGQVCGIYTCSNYQSSNHFDVDLGGGIKLYATHGFFVRPEARYYFVNNNTDFSSNHFGRYGLSIGYTFH